MSFLQIILPLSDTVTVGRSDLIGWIESNSTAQLAWREDSLEHCFVGVGSSMPSERVC